MSRKDIFYLILVALILGGMIVGRFFAPEHEIIVQPALAHNFPAPIPQHVSEKIWKSSPTRKLFTLVAQEKGPLMKPGMIRVYEDKGIYIFDYGDLALKKFSLYDGTIIQKYGKGRGQSPGEFGNPTDFLVTEEGLVWIADPVNTTISVFNADGSLSRIIRTLTRPYRLLLYGAEDMIIMPEAGEYLFEIYKTSGERIDAFGKIIEAQEKNIVALDGSIVKSSSDGFIYVPVYTGLILSYTIDKQLRFYVQMTDPIPLPKVIKSAAGRTYVDRKAPYASLSLNTTENELFMLREDDPREDKKGNIDVYSNETGFYLYSMLVPEPCSRIFVTKDYVYTLNGAGVSKWQR